MNEVVTVLVNAGLAAVLLVSGALKLSTARSASSDWSRLGLPDAVTRSPLPRLWPYVEIVLALALLVVPAPWSTVVSVLVLAATIAFLTVVAVALRQGRQVACRCFGSLDNTPVDRGTLVRNTGLVLLAVLGIAGSLHGSVVGTALALEPDERTLAQVAALVIGVVVVLRLVDHLRRPVANDAPNADPVGDAGPPSTPELGSHLLPDLFGARPDVRRFVGEDRSVLVFLSTTCGTCRTVAAELPQWRADLAARGITVRAVTDQPAAKALVTFPALGAFLHQDADDALARSLGITDVPAAVYVGADGTPTVSQGPVVGPYAMSDLIANLRLEEVVPS